MKSFLVAMSLVVISSSAFAQQRIDLAAGAKAKLNVGIPTFVTCEQSSQDQQQDALSACTVERNAYQLFDVGINGKVVSSNLSSLDSALDTIKKLRTSGLCK